MKTTEINQSVNPPQSRTAAFVAGFGILAMIYPAMIVLPMLESTLVRGDAARTAQNVIAADQFGSGMWMLLVVAALDIVVGVALWKLFAPASRNIARSVMVSRLVYTVVFTIAILQLVGVASNPGESLGAITRFNDIWHASLLIFGIHLLLIGWMVLRLAFKTDYLWRTTGVIVGGLLLIGGAGYLADNTGLLFITGYQTSTVMVIALATGETLFAFWIFAKSLKFFAIPSLIRKLRGQ